MTTETTGWVASEFIDSPEAEREYLVAAFEEGSYRFLAQAILDVATARGMADLARQAGLTRDELYALVTRLDRSDPSDLSDLMVRLGVPAERLVGQTGQSAAE